ncbi:MAG: adenine nucleotide alpha hydrolase family protein [Crenarchaeota archaeon]|nr:adenine nucleotide alpha hydrolase family protein [Thermoproteota archaeon]
MPRGKCRVCGREAEYWVPWANAWFCRDHYIEYYNRRIKRVWDKYFPNDPGDTLIAVSGGKDSVALLYSVSKILMEKGVRHNVLFIDLGIPGYSDESLKIVKWNAGRLGLNVEVARLEDYGFTLRDIHRLVKTRRIRRPVCSICGMIKRYLMNRYAYEHGYSLVLTGHNLDDMIGFTLASLVSGRIEDLVKLRPYVEGHDRLVARGKPLLFTYGVENKWYVEAIGARIVEAVCPYRTGESSVNTELRDAVLSVDKKHPGLAILMARNTVDKLIPRIRLPGKTLVRCSVCGYPSSSDPCGFCRLREKVSRLLSSKKK